MRKQSERKWIYIPRIGYCQEPTEAEKQEAEAVEVVEKHRKEKGAFYITDMMYGVRHTQLEKWLINRHDAMKRKNKKAGELIAKFLAIMKENEKKEIKEKKKKAA